VSQLDMQSASPDAALALLAGPGAPEAAAAENAAGPTRDAELLRAHEQLLGRGSLIPLAFGTTELLVAPGVHGLALDALGAPRFNDAWISTP
jgi:hypothetical protein